MPYERVITYTTHLFLRTRLRAQVGAERYNLFMGCPEARTATLVLRGGSEQFIDEADRSLHDAIMIVRRALKHAQVGDGSAAAGVEEINLGRVPRCSGRSAVEVEGEIGYQTRWIWSHGCCGCGFRIAPTAASRLER